MRYLRLLGRSYVLRLMVGTLVGRLPSAMAAVAIPLAMRHQGASYGFLGLVAATFAISAAVGGPLLARIVDKIGQPGVLLSTAAASGLGFVAIAAAPTSPLVVIPGAVLAGAATPPFEPCLRALWPDVVPAGELETAYALDSSTQEIVFVVGPLLVTGCALLGAATLALCLGAALGLLGAACVATSPPARGWEPSVRAPDWLGALRSAKLALLLVSLTGVGGAIGTLNIYAVAFAETHHAPGGAPMLLAMNAAGALVGGLCYGAVHWRSRPETRLIVLLAALAAAYALLISTPSTGWMFAVMIVTGLFLAPVLTTAFTQVPALAPHGTVTEAFAWLVTLMTVGVSIGSAITGAALASGAEVLAAAVGALSVGVGCLVLLLQGWLSHDHSTLTSAASETSS